MAMTDIVEKPPAICDQESEPPARASSAPPGDSSPGDHADVNSKNPGNFKGIVVGALVAALFGTLSGAATNYWASYLSRRDQHAQEATKCKREVESLLTTTSLIHETVQSALSQIKNPPPANKSSNIFVLPPYDEIIHAQDASFDVLDSESRYSIINLEAYYRSLRDDLSNTSDVYHTGETFGVPPTSGNKDAYEKILDGLVRTSQATIGFLNASHHCSDLARTSFF